jgi:recombination protein RecT
MTMEEIEAVRKRSRAGENGPWVTDAGEMRKKTVIRRHSKKLPLSAEFRDALEKDADAVDVDSLPEAEVIQSSAAATVLEEKAAHAEGAPEGGAAEPKPDEAGGDKDDLPFFTREELVEQVKAALKALPPKKAEAAAKQMNTQIASWESDLDDNKKLETFVSLLKAAK